jgi:uncharacterized glyoxalase superfamily protein PhnB
MLSYENVGEAADWLVRAFGFEERGERFHDEEGRATHVELGHGDGLVMLGWPGPHYRGPRRLAELSEDVRRMLDNPYVVDGVLVEVADVDAHAERARAAGAEIIRGPEDAGAAGRLYTAVDPEGHRWMFTQSTS